MQSTIEKKGDEAYLCALYRLLNGHLLSLLAASSEYESGLGTALFFQLVTRPLHKELEAKEHAYIYRNM